MSEASDSGDECPCARFAMKLVGVSTLQGKELYIELETDLAEDEANLIEKLKSQVQLEFCAAEQMVAFREYCEASTACTPACTHPLTRVHALQCAQDLFPACTRISRIVDQGYYLLVRTE